MIQRIQSVFLFLTILCAAGVLVFPIWKKENPSPDKQEKVVLTAYSFTHFQGKETASDSENDKEIILSSTATFYIAGAAVLSMLIAFFSLLGYKNRMKQLKLNAINALILVGILAGSVYFITKGEQLTAPDLKGTYEFGFYGAIAAALFNLLANRFIRRDEQLVRSSNRMR